VITGDALFQNSIGRTDLPGGDYDTLILSIRKRLLILPPETIVYPGHGPSSTIGEEAIGNPFLAMAE
jgi:glyoxylase-like metal-dependent hydrolase (beta-lactamase superfamily II)